ncbi:hypothetical protein [Fulvivirga sp.]|uniref:hypothetical protein n=1 Tax=Fulvivirga sp. TaxID=1931237 RepID=UPI0032EF10EA
MNIIGIIGTLLWLKVEQGWEPIVTSIGLIGTLIAQIFNQKGKGSSTVFKQKGGKNSSNYQSGGDINISTNDKGQDN